MDSKEIDTIKKLYEGLNSNDIESVMKLFAPEIKRVEFEGSPGVGTFSGLEEMRAHFIKGRSTWAEGGCFPESFKVNDDKIVVFVHIKVRLKDKLEWIDGRTADGYAFKNGLITEMNSYFENSQALKWAGM